MNERGMLLLLPCMELLLAAAPGVAPDALQPSLMKLLGLIMSGQVRGRCDGGRSCSLLLVGDARSGKKWCLAWGSKDCVHAVPVRS